MQALRAEELSNHHPRSVLPFARSDGPRHSAARRRLGPAPRIPYTVAIGPALLLALWAVSSWGGWLDARVLSGPWSVAVTARDLVINGRLQAHLLTSAQRAFLGLSLG